MDTPHSHGLLLSPDDLRPGMLVMVHSAVVSVRVCGPTSGDAATLSVSMPSGDGAVLCVEQCMFPFILCRAMSAPQGPCFPIDVRRTRLMRCRSTEYVEALHGGIDEAADEGGADPESSPG